MKARIGFIGTGVITEAMVTGLLASPAEPLEIIVSARNEAVSSRLAAAYPQVLVSQSNQQIIERADTVVLAIRPQVAESVIRALVFRPGQKIISVIAATPRASLAQWVNEQVDIVQAIPLPFVAQRTGVTAIYPPSLEVAALFNQLGRAVECETKVEYDLLAAASALMSTYYGVLHGAVSWLAAQGLPSDKARDYISHMSVALSDAALSREPASFGELSTAYATPGGLNEQVLREFKHHGGERALHLALDQVIKRIRCISD
ncbi:pyrroline-5-carboxylate reductase [Pseudomonas sp. NPDC089407]|uniref:pyrroline-5-carboxylate reductase n=1 Tax=Pseudomonas sp. NPDC089407 TaxID=3364464 RepID=UPI00384A9AD4